MIVIGNKPPVLDATVHWFIYRGLPDNNIILIINQQDILENLPEGLGNKFEYDDKLLNTPLALNILRTVKESKVTHLKGNVISGLVLIGVTPDEIIQLIKDDIFPLIVSVLPLLVLF